MGKLTAATNAGANPVRGTTSSGHAKRAAGNLLQCACNSSSVCSCSLVEHDQAAYCSKNLAKVLVAYEQKHPGRLKKDLEKQTGLQEFLAFNESEPVLNEQLTDAQANQLVKVLKQSKHGLLKNVKLGSPSHLRKDLKAAWAETLSESKLQQIHSMTSGDPDGIQHGIRGEGVKSDALRSPAGSTKVTQAGSSSNKNDELAAARAQEIGLSKVEIDVADAGPSLVRRDEQVTKPIDVKSGPYNPFEEGADEELLDSNQSKDVKSDPLNPFDEGADEEFRDSNPFKDVKSDPLNPFDEGADEGAADSSPFKVAYVEQKTPDDNADITESSHVQAPLQSSESNSTDDTYISEVFLGMLNQYLRTDNGRTFGAFNKAHHTKMARDIRKNPETIGKYIVLDKPGEECTVRWNGKPANKEAVQGMLDAFKKEHSGKSSFFELITKFNFVDVGYQLIDTATHVKIISHAAEPNLHRPGKSAVVEMKHAVMSEVLSHLSDSSRRDKPLPDSVLSRLIAHYGKVEQTQTETQQSAEKLAEKNELSLNDQGFVQHIQRVFHQVKTENRIKGFNAKVEDLTKQIEEETVKVLKDVVEKHNAGKVDQRTVGKIEDALGKASKEYADKMLGKNIYPAQLSAVSPIREQIKKEVNSNHKLVLQSVVTNYEKAYMENLIDAGESFSATKYLVGKSHAKATGNIIEINKNLCRLPEQAETFHGRSLQALTELSGDETLKTSPDDKFQVLQQKLVDTLRTKVLANSSAALLKYDGEIQSIKWDHFGKVSAELECTKKLATLSQELEKNVKELRAQSFPGTFKIEQNDVELAVQKVTKPLLVKIQEHLPEVKSIGKTLQSAFARAFKPTPARVLGSIPLVGGLTFALAALPKPIAIPLGITAAVFFPLSLLGWVGWNIYKRFDQRSDLQQLRAQIEGNLRDIGKSEV
ncbi:hypothetical protein SAMN05660489_05847 [Pseudomonas sp. LAMO17WK12:I10]|uniref:hypothetical protein n=1 Tax=unclassified Pseudomonas TaxID=196821 RepID=UPI000BD3C6A6|nr:MULTISPECIES: hypothetical protein [unclassified Pseudomonas]PXX54017.1 hypothetical protein H160_05840 [Pseudomonas sp. LAMO17WK12:I9]SNY51966.1 hypothetical protein SAMN05660489_05847 [Pseudomonas sp. LAMO17WK12:I10]